MGLQMQRGWFDAIYDDSDPERVFIVGRHENGCWIGVVDDDDCCYQFDECGQCRNCDDFMIVRYADGPNEPTHRDLTAIETVDAMVKKRLVQVVGHSALTTISAVSGDAVSLLGWEWMSFADFRRRCTWEGGEPCGARIQQGQPSA